LGIALGLANAYFKRCAKKGLIKISSVPARRFAYYLTPQGFAEKALLTQSFLSQSFTFFRTARSECRDLLTLCSRLGWNRVLLFGVSDLAEIMVLCAADLSIQLVGIVSESDDHKVDRLAGLPVFARTQSLPAFDGVLVTDMMNPQLAFNHAIERFGSDHVQAPPLLRIVRAEVSPS